MADIRVGIELFPHLAESPTFNERDFCLGNITARQFFQQFEGGDTSRNFIAACLDLGFDAIKSPQYNQHQGWQAYASIVDLLRRCTQ